PHSRTAGIRLWCQQASPVVAANSRPGPARSPPWCSRDGGCVLHPQGQPSRTGSRPNDALHRAYPLPRSAPEGRQICEGYEVLSPQKKNVGNGQASTVIRGNLTPRNDSTLAEWQVLAYSVEKVRGGVVGVVRRSNEGNVHLP